MDSANVGLVAGVSLSLLAVVGGGLYITFYWNGASRWSTRRQVVKEEIFKPADYPTDGTEEKKKEYRVKLYRDFKEAKERWLRKPLSSMRKTVKKKKRVILFTDIGDDIDDFAAFALLLNRERFGHCEIAHVVTSGHGNHRERAKILKKLLSRASREAIKISFGVMPARRCPLKQAKWVADHEVCDSKFELPHEPQQAEGHPDYTDPKVQMAAWGDSDACRSLHDTIDRLVSEQSIEEEPLVFLSIGPLHEVAAFMAKYPDDCKKVHFVGMQGSMDVGYYGRQGAVRENNVKLGVGACQHVMASGLFITKRLATLDSCGIVQLDKGDFFRKLTESQNPMAQSYMENMEIWHGLFVDTRPWLQELYRWPVRSSILFDTVAAMIALEDPDAESSFFDFEEVDLLVTESAHTVDVCAFDANPDEYIQRAINMQSDNHDDIKREWMEEAKVFKATDMFKTGATRVQVTKGWRNFEPALGDIAYGIAGETQIRS